MPPTINPNRARCECAAMNPSVVQPSSIGSSTLPTPRIWKKWSITQIESKPTSSAWRTMPARVGPMASGPPGHVKDEIWRPSFIVAERTSLPFRGHAPRSEEHTSELQSRSDLVCRLLLEKKKKKNEARQKYKSKDTNC